MSRSGIAWAFIGLAGIAAASVRPMPLDELCAGADRIVLGTVQSMTSAWEGQMIMTDVAIIPAETWKGAVAPVVHVKVPGGTVGGVTLSCSEAPRFDAGESTVCFIKTTNGSPQVYGWFRGKFSVTGDRIREMKNTSLAQMRSQVSKLVEHK